MKEKLSKSQLKEIKTANKSQTTRRLEKLKKITKNDEETRSRSAKLGGGEKNEKL